MIFFMKIFKSVLTKLSITAPSIIGINSSLKLISICDAK